MPVHLCNRVMVHPREDAIAAGKHVAPARRSLLYAAPDLFTHPLQVRLAQKCNICVANQCEVIAEVLLSLRQIDSSARIKAVKTPKTRLNGHR